MVKKLREVPKGVVITQPLEVGDFFYNLGYVVERKRPNDLLSAIKGDGRFYSQLANMNNYVEKQNPNGRAILIIEGDFRDTWNGMKDRLLLAVAEASVASFYHVGVLYSFDETFTYHILRYWLEKEAGKVSHISIRPKRRIETTDERLEYIVSGFPSIGGKRAKDILHYFGNLPNFISAELPELEEILGNKLANKVWAILCANYGERRND